jgi:putative phosphoesterase
VAPIGRVAAIYDIHGNLPALEATLRDVRETGVDCIVVGGDVVPGPMPRETLACLQGLDLPVQFIQGNGDRQVVARMRGTATRELPEPHEDVLQWNARQLQLEDGLAISSWPAILRAAIAGLGEVLFCHATPRNDTDIFTRLTPDDRLAPIFAGLDAQVVVCGHTHMQFDRTIGRIRVVNAGSVGMPFGEPGAYWLLLGPDVELRWTPYDLKAAAGRIRATAYPQAEAFAARNVLDPPSDASILEAYAKAEWR